MIDKKSSLDRKGDSSIERKGSTGSSVDKKGGSFTSQSLQVHNKKDEESRYSRGKSEKSNVVIEVDEESD